MGRGYTKVYPLGRIPNSEFRLIKFTDNCSLFTAHCSLLTAHCSLLTAHCSLSRQYHSSPHRLIRIAVNKNKTTRDAITPVSIIK